MRTYDDKELAVGDLFLDSRGRFYETREVGAMVATSNVVHAQEMVVRRGVLFAHGDVKMVRTEACVTLPEGLGGYVILSHGGDLKALYEELAAPHRARHRAAIQDRKSEMWANIANQGHGV